MHITLDSLKIPRRYTLTHSDLTSDLYLTIGSNYDFEKISGWKTKFMRDEVLAEWLVNEDSFRLHVYCHVNGGFVLGKAKWRYNIFMKELPLVLEAPRYGDRELFTANPELDKSKIMVNFQSSQKRFRKTKDFGEFSNYI